MSEFRSRAAGPRSFDPDSLRSRGPVAVRRRGADAFEFDAVIHQYTLAARELWKTCAMPAGDIEGVACMLEDLAARGETVDWWEGRRAAAARPLIVPGVRSARRVGPRRPRPCVLASGV